VDDIGQPESSGSSTSAGPAVGKKKWRRIIPQDSESESDADTVIDDENATGTTIAHNADIWNATLKWPLTLTFVNVQNFFKLK